MANAPKREVVRKVVDTAKKAAKAAEEKAAGSATTTEGKSTLGKIGDTVTTFFLGRETARAIFGEAIAKTATAESVRIERDKNYIAAILSQMWLDQNDRAAAEEVEKLLVELNGQETHDFLKHAAETYAPDNKSPGIKLEGEDVLSELLKDTESTKNFLRYLARKFKGNTADAKAYLKQGIQYTGPYAGKWYTTLLRLGSVNAKKTAQTLADRIVKHDEKAKAEFRSRSRWKF